MRGYSDYGDLPRGGTLVPEDPVGGRRSLLRIRLKDLLSVRAPQAGEFVDLQIGTWVRNQQPDRLEDRLATPLLPLGSPQLAQLPPGMIRPTDRDHL